jgi:hypothetical protein
MKKHLLITTVFAILLTGLAELTSCSKNNTTAPDPLAPILGDYVGTLVDSDLYQHRSNAFTSYPIKIEKLTSSKVHFRSTIGQAEPFDANVTAMSTGFNFYVLPQVSGSDSVYGANLASMHYPAGFTAVYDTSTKQLKFSILEIPSFFAPSMIAYYTGTKQ